MSQPFPKREHHGGLEIFRGKGNIPQLVRTSFGQLGRPLWIFPLQMSSLVASWQCWRFCGSNYSKSYSNIYVVALYFVKLSEGKEWSVTFWNTMTGASMFFSSSQGPLPWGAFQIMWEVLQIEQATAWDPHSLSRFDMGFKCRVPRPWCPSSRQPELRMPQWLAVIKSASSSQSWGNQWND